MRKLMKKISIGAALTAMVLFAPSTFAETSTSPSGEVTGVLGETVRVRITGIEDSETELRLALKNSNDEFAEFEESEGVYRVIDWKSAETDKTVLTLSGADSFEITGLAPGDYRLIPLSTDFTTKSSEFILVGSGEYEFSVSRADNTESESADPEETPADDPADSGEIPADDSADPEEIPANDPADPEETPADEPAVIDISYAEKKLTLPETGGIGTGVFYIVGGTMAAVSAAMLISRFKNRKK